MAFRALSQNSKTTPYQPLFKKDRRDSHSKPKKQMSKSPFKMSKMQKRPFAKDQIPFVFTSHENIQNGESIQKMNESDELESIEQDIANLEQFKNFGKISDQFIFELEESEEHQMQFLPHENNDGFYGQNMHPGYLKQSSQFRKYSKSSISDQKSYSTQSNPEELKKRRMIVEYLKIVKAKISEMEKKIENVTKEAEYYKTKSKELEASRDKVTADVALYSD